MWKEIVAILCLFTCSTSSFGSTPFQDSLIGEDFGILNQDDLAIPTCWVRSKPFNESQEDSVNSFPYWKCFPLSHVNFDCGENQKRQQVIMGFVAQDQGQVHEYLSRSVIPLSSCLKWKQNWKTVTHNQSHVCISGSFIRKKVESDKGAHYSWIFESFKTRLGCSSYFEGGCSLKYQVQHGCKLNLNGA